MMTDKGFKANTMLKTVVGVLVILVAHFSNAAEVYHLDNGINATIYSAEEISAELVTVNKNIPTLVHPSAGTVELEKGSQQWYPMNQSVVVSALKKISGIQTDIDVEIFLLPAPPAGIGCSFARRGAIYLAPAAGEVPAAAVANITTHEMGHVFTWAFVDGRSNRWDQYKQLRGLTTANNGPEAIHANRAREILAEDFRFLFGGDLANYSGSIENHDLVLPTEVPGLQDMLVEFVSSRAVGPVLVSSTAFPNPCNPMTTIEMALPESAAGREAVCRIFDIRGSLVRTIRGGYSSNSRIAVQWDGTNDASTVASSGRYLYVMQVGSAVAKGSVTLVR